MFVCVCLQDVSGGLKDVCVCVCLQGVSGGL